MQYILSITNLINGCILSSLFIHFIIFLHGKQKNELRAHSQREKIFLKMGIVDPQVPLPPDNLKIDNHFSAPFKYRNRNKQVVKLIDL